MVAQDIYVSDENGNVNSEEIGKAFVLVNEINIEIPCKLIVEQFDNSDGFSVSVCIDVIIISENAFLNILKPILELMQSAIFTFHQRMISFSNDLGSLN